MLVGEEPRQWKTITAQIREIKKKWGLQTPLGKRRTTFEAPPAVSENFDLTDVLVEREPITVVVTQKGWIRALKGQVSDLANLQYKGDNALNVAFFAETTSKIMVLTTDGKIFTLDASKLPGGRGAGEPIRLLADIDDGEDVSAVFVHRPNGKMLLAATDGRGFIAAENDMIANTKKGKMLLNVDAPESGKEDWARFIVAIDGDTVAAIGENRKLLCFPLSEIPEMTRGKGVRLQRYKDGGLSDIKTFALESGLSWTDSSGRVYNVGQGRACRMAGNPRRRRPPPAKEFSEEQQVRVTGGGHAAPPPFHATRSGGLAAPDPAGPIRRGRTVDEQATRRRREKLARPAIMAVFRRVGIPHGSFGHPDIGVGVSRSQQRRGSRGNAAREKHPARNLRRVHRM